MRFDSALDLQARVFKEVFDFQEVAVAAGIGSTETSLYVDPILVEAAAIGKPRRKSAKRRVVEDVALGVSDGDQTQDSAKLAVLVQNRLQLKSPVIDRIFQIAKDEVEVIYIGRQKALWTQSRVDPIRIGSSISPVTVGYAGTLGCFCRDGLTGATCILSNNHVLADVNTVPAGTNIMQQGALDGGTPGPDDIAALLRYVPIQFGGLPNAVDAAIARTINHRRQEDHAGIFDCAEQPKQVTSLQPAAIATALPGMRVLKTGRTTCHTVGRVRAVNVNNYLVNMGVGVARFDGQITIEMDMTPPQPFSRPGDSGSIIVDENGQPVGLLFAGSQSGGAGNLGITGANPISSVTAQLGITLI